MNASTAISAVGGYFELEQSIGSGIPFIDEAIGYQSARSALAAVLRAARPKTVWAPDFICGVVNDTLRAVDTNLRRYGLDETLGIPKYVDPAIGDLVLCVNYFGISSACVQQAIDRFGADRVVVDASQALFYRHRTGSTTIYSPRKFLGVPDGGLVLTSWQLPQATDADENDTFVRCRHLLYRRAGMVETGYAAFLKAEESLSGCTPVAMSRTTRALLRSVDLEGIAALRVRNYFRLAEMLGQAGFEVPALAAGDVPLCCPVQCDDAARLRTTLAVRRIFTPTYWRDAAIPEDDSVAVRMRDRVVYLPCDQRCGELELQRIADAVIESMEDA